MKSILCALLFVSSTSFAGDVVAVGAKLREGNVMINANNSALSCQFKTYEAAPSCFMIENINKTFNIVLNPEFAFGYIACGSGFEANSAGKLNTISKEARILAIGSDPDDVVWTMIKNYEANVEKNLAEVKQIKTQAKLDEVYINDCVNGEGPSNGSILEQICH